MLYKTYTKDAGSIKDSDCDADICGVQTPSLKVWTKFQGLLECDWLIINWALSR